MNCKKIFYVLCFLWMQHVFASEAPNGCWKVSFFNGYMKEYGALESPSHEGIASVLQSSFDQAVAIAPEKDQHLVAGVRDQVAYFVGLEDEEEKERELKKCQDGMKQAQSPWVRWAPESVKAHFFVNKFVEEAAGRKKE